MKAIVITLIVCTTLLTIAILHENRIDRRQNERERWEITTAPPTGLLTH